MSKLKELREKQNLTQEELAEKSGISIRTIQRIEAGAQPKGHTLRELAKSLGIEEKELLNHGEEEQPINYSLIKLINLSSLPIAFLPPVNIIIPLVIMFITKQFNPLTKQIISVQILWTVLSVIIFMISAIVKNWFLISNRFTLVVMIVLFLTNVFIILRNTAEIDKKQKLRIKLNFSII